jgi:hypothetical protein
MTKIPYFLVSLLILLRCAPQNNNSTNVVVKDTIIVKDTVFINDTTKIIKVDTLNILDTINIYPQKIIVEIKPEEIKADSFIADFPLSNLIDDAPYYSRDKKGTRFALPGYPHWLVFNFDKLAKIDSIAVNTFLWNEDYNHTITIFSWGDSLTQFNTKSVLYSGHAIKQSQVS